ncbi:sensor histidine kinase [Rubrivirga sp. IMCC45206]|uniref:sensor histidine kinase n=1 Tax=Rubrivirga sp. IMCC45206 TaxID=3391614 RepID=UPI00398FA313
MSPSVRLRVLWERYVAPSRAEHDPGFRAVLDGATVIGLRVAGLFGIVALVGVGMAVVVTSMVGGGGVGDVGDSATQIGEALSDKLFVYAAAAVFFVVARFRPGLVLGRWLVALFVLVGSLVITWEELVRGDLEFMAAWLSLLLLFTVGTVPFQPIQTMLLGGLITVLHTGALALAGTTGSLVDAGEAVRRLSFLLLVTFLSTAMSAALYAGRRGQYRGTQRLARLRDRLAARGEQLETRGAELEAQQAELTASLARLEAAQTRLVQQEKMASLGQLTAGVAHELKNPLNFVNNFAQLLVELLDDFEEEVREVPERPVGEALDESADLLDDMRSNALKIREHGRRADGIIRSMLAHSRAQPGPSREAPLNSLLKEYVGLAYHGMRAEHSGFNVELDLDLDEAVGTVVMVPEEMGRVFLNLLDNALQALRERAAAGEPGFAPVLRVESRPWGKGARVRITDNGPGIPEGARTKIFEPFFTTKPTGEGTGLGLSLAYEIVVHGHGGELTVETEEGEGTTFTVGLTGLAPPKAMPAPVREATS